MRAIRAAAAAVVLALLGLLVWDVSPLRPRRRGGEGGQGPYRPRAPRRSLPFFGGSSGTFDLAAYRGKVVVAELLGVLVRRLQARGEDAA